MKKLKLEIISKSEKSFFIDVDYAQSFGEKLVGLLNKKNLNCNEGLLIKNCKSIHTWGMQFSIDVVFARKMKKVKNFLHFEIVDIYEDVRPWKIFPIQSRLAQDVFEFQAGFVKNNRIQLGGELCLHL